jgi:erythromycin esterase-like protein
VLSKLQWEILQDAGAGSAVKDKLILLNSKKFRGCSKLDQFNAEQNLECMISADEYYTKQRLEPPGSRASWNARDQHMMTTVIRLRENSQDLFGIEQKDLKIAIWAHNSHVGDATATPMGGESFKRNEKWNLGQMCRNVLENVFVVGLYSYTGSVRAAHEWGGEGAAVPMMDAVPYSFEHRMHERFEGRSGLFNFRKLLAGAASPAAYAAYNPHDTPVQGTEFVAIHEEVRVL